MLQTDGSVGFAICPQQCHHFTENRNPGLFTAGTGKCLRNNPTDNFIKSVFVWTPIRHECSQKLCRIHNDQTPALNERGNIQSLNRQPVEKSVAMRVRGNHDSGILASQCVPYIFAQLLKQKFVLGIKLDAVLMIPVLVPGMLPYFYL